MCADARADATCLPVFEAVAGRPFVLPVTFAACGCCPMATCVVESVARTNTLYLRSGQCPDTCICDDCSTPPEALCDVPSLSVGDWAVVVNDAHAFTLPVRERATDLPAPACVSYAEPDACRREGPILFGSSIPTRVCVREQSSFNREQSSIELSWDCTDCRDRFGPCHVRVEQRLTDDLPDGGDIHIDAQLYRSACDGDCPPACGRLTRECFLPHLEPGAFYRVIVGDAIVDGFTAGTLEEVCSDELSPVPG